MRKNLNLTSDEGDTDGDDEVARWFKTSAWYIYISHALSAWGDRMWQFAVGLFLIIIAPESLQLTAIFGLVQGAAVMLFGAIIGDWIDRTPRLKAAQVTLVLQNSNVILSAVAVALVIQYKLDMLDMWYGWLLQIADAVIIIFAVIARLASVGNKISVERDWIVEICGRDTDRLATMSAVLRRIDLITNIIAPIVTGQVMAFTSDLIAAIFIAGWNLISVFVEYFLLWKVYKSVPALAIKIYKGKKSHKVIDNVETHEDDRSPSVNLHTSAEEEADPMAGSEGGEPDESTTDTLLNKDNASMPDTEQAAHTNQQEVGCCTRFGKLCGTMFGGVTVLYTGWKTYMGYKVAFAGVGLACLYMTVLGFDNITTGYAYSQGMSEWLLGVLMAVGALIGIIGTLAYPVIKRRVGLERTGLFSMAAEMLCLTMCVMSVWAPGSPFNPNYFQMDRNATEGYYNSSALNVKMVSLESVTATTNYTHPSNDDGAAGIGGPEMFAPPPSYLSLALLMAGIVTARFGLWISDLTITQLLLEHVDETERGIVNGVQDSINSIMDMLKFAMVVALPQPEVFGYLIIISFGFILLGAGSFAIYSYKIRGHVMPHFGKCVSGAPRSVESGVVEVEAGPHYTGQNTEESPALCRDGKS